MDKKLDARLAPMENDIKSIKLKQRRINSIIENEIRSDIKLLTENYEPVAKQYEKGASKIKAIQYDILYYEKSNSRTQPKAAKHIITNSNYILYYGN